ncbi:MAG: 2-phospho-L-lactate guanylyltransferase [Archaeoglobaceae archaeon]
MKVVIPFKPVNPKSRLSGILNAEERRKFAEFMLLDVINVLKELNLEIKVVSTSKIEIECVKVVEDVRSLDDCINAELEDLPKAIVMSDLPLLNKEVLNRFFSCDADIVIAPGRKGGTNMLLVRKKGFKVSYHYCSFLKHLDIAKSLGFRCKVFDSFYASLDIDDETDLLELMIHGSGKLSKKYLESIGFRILMEKTPRLKRI